MYSFKELVYCVGRMVDSFLGHVYVGLLLRAKYIILLCASSV